MPKVNDAVTEIQNTITRRLKLEAPRFQLEPAGAKVGGSIISSTFRGMSDFERQRRIWDALDKAYGAESVHRDGTFLAFTPDEWELGDDSDAHD
jgi:acid stress-induced BolA-like protein IbaG/YrbA